MKKEYLILLTITAIGGLLRFWDLGGNALWIDEAFFGFLIKSDNVMQEFVPVYIAKLFGFKSEFLLRFQSALFGTLTIPAMYLVVKKYKLHAAFLVAVFPLFVFWSRMARPYAVAGLFLVLSWRWWWIIILALLTTPIAIVGIIRHKWFIIAGVTALALIFYFIRPDSGRDWWHIEIFINSSRWWYLPILTIFLLVFDRLLPYLASGSGTINKAGMVQKRSKIQQLEKRAKR